MKKYFALPAVFLSVLLVMSGCRGAIITENHKGDKPLEKSSESAVMKDAVTKYREKSEYMFNRINELYGVKGFDLYLENYPPKPDDRGVSYLWPYSAMLSGLDSLIRLPGMETKYMPAMVRLLNGLEKYRDETRTPPAYQDYPPEFASGKRFYDDNMWLGLDFVDLYDLTKVKKYLDKAEEIFTFIKTGWSDELGGGIYWCEQDRDTKNTCSNGPAAVLALKLYRQTGNKDYLGWGLKIYNWTREKLQAPEGIYWDSIKLDGTIDKTAYAYNSGTMLQSAVLLYKITGDDSYLAEAQRVAKASLDLFAPAASNGMRFFPNRDPWFTTVLFRGYQALYEVDGNPEYIDAVIKDIDYAWSNARDGHGLISRDWSGSGKEDADCKWLLDEACMVELYARASAIKEKQ